MPVSNCNLPTTFSAVARYGKTYAHASIGVFLQMCKRGCHMLGMRMPAASTFFNPLSHGLATSLLPSSAALRTTSSALSLTDDAWEQCEGAGSDSGTQTGRARHSLCRRPESRQTDFAGLRDHPDRHVRQLLAETFDWQQSRGGKGEQTAHGVVFSSAACDAGGHTCVRDIGFRRQQVGLMALLTSSHRTDCSTATSCCTQHAHGVGVTAWTVDRRLRGVRQSTFSPQQ